MQRQSRHQIVSVHVRVRTCSRVCESFRVIRESVRRRLSGSRDTRQRVTNIGRGREGKTPNATRRKKNIVCRRLGDGSYGGRRPTAAITITMVNLRNVITILRGARRLCVRRAHTQPARPPASQPSAATVGRPPHGRFFATTTSPVLLAVSRDRCGRPCSRACARPRLPTQPSRTRATGNLRSPRNRRRLPTWPDPKVSAARAMAAFSF